MPFWIREIERIARLERAGRDRHRGPAQVGVAGGYHQARVDAIAAPPSRNVAVVPDGVTTGAANTLSELVVAVLSPVAVASSV